MNDPYEPDPHRRQVPSHPGMKGQMPGPAAHPGDPSPTSNNAVASLVLGIAGWVLCGLLTAIPAVICGHLALKETARDPRIQGRGMAIAGLIMGYLLVALMIIAAAVLAIMISVVGWDEFSGGLETTPVFPDDPADAECVVILPDEHPLSEPIPAAIWLHGYGWNPSEISLLEEDYQKIANDLRIAIIGISATSKMGEGSYEWAEDRESDYSHLTAVLDYHSHGLTLDWPNVALFGFSQGAKVAGDLASHHPGKFRGAILISPGGKKDDNVPTIPTQGNAAQYYVCVVGADEALGNVTLTRTYARKLRKLGAEVFLKEYEGVEEHSTPPDYDEKLPEWLAKILGIELPKP